MRAALAEWALTSSFLILAVLALRALLGRRVSARLRYALWAVALVRLLIPIQLFPIPIPGPSAPLKIGLEQWAAPPLLRPDPFPAGSSGLSDASAPGDTAPASLPAPAPERAEPLAAPSALGRLWAAGSGVMAAALVLSNVRFARRLRRARVPLDCPSCPLPVYAAEGLPSPCLFGPAVYLTPQAAEDPVMLRHVLAHETTHFRHGDHLWNVLKGAALAIHWWNPLVWLAAALSRRDCELACDEGTLKRLGEEERFAYGRTLLTLLAARPRPGGLLTCATTMAGGRSCAEERIKRIARAPKRWRWAAALAVPLAALACACAFGRAETPEAGPAPPTAADTDAPAPDPSPISPLDSLTFSMDGAPFGAWSGGAAIQGLDAASITWYPSGQYDAYPYGLLWFEDPAFLGGCFADRPFQGSAWWLDPEHSAVAVSLLRIQPDSGTAGLAATCSVDLSSGAILEKGVHDELGEEPLLTDDALSSAGLTLAQLLAAAEDWYSGSAGAAPSPEPSALERCRGVIQENDLLYSPKDGEWMTLNELCAKPGFDPAWAEISSFSVLDLDGDGAQEVILGIDVAHYRDWCVVLHGQDNAVRGYILYIRWLNTLTLKDNGAFGWSSSASENGWGKLRFTADGYDTERTIWHADMTHYLDGRTVSQAEYEAADSRQAAAPDAVWYDFTQENIRALLSP